MTLHPAALYVGSPKHRHRWQPAIIVEDPKGRTVLWQGAEVFHFSEEAQRAAEAHAQKPQPALF